MTEFSKVANGVAAAKVSLASVEKADKAIERRYNDKLVVNPDLGRTLVSFQANKKEAGYRWCKYREGFSASLIRYILAELNIEKGRLLDPFAGSGTSLFCAREKGLPSTGIELLPSSCQIIKVRDLSQSCDRQKVVRALKRFRSSKRWNEAGDVVPFPHLRITTGAFPKKTERALGRFLFEVEKVRDKTVRSLLRFAATCILEEISYTRKDGQYLRWDGRSGRKGTFNKGRIEDFSFAIQRKIGEIIDDMANFTSASNDLPADKITTDLTDIALIEDSCLAALPKLKSQSFSAIVTSPPYCNRYDYTRTYALELAMLGIDEPAIKDLRQTMLTCTVENRVKENLGRHSSNQQFTNAIEAFESQAVLRRITDYLNKCKERGLLNNRGIPRMVENYFREMSLVIHECARVLKPGAPIVMVNDNVRYQGAHVPVDLILCDFAAAAGLVVEKIWVLPRGKGNSSQQMGKHGRAEVRKCVYVWRKPKTVSAKPRAKRAVSAR